MAQSGEEASTGQVTGADALQYAGLEQLAEAGMPVASIEEAALAVQALAGYVPVRPDGRGKLPKIGGGSGW